MTPRSIADGVPRVVYPGTVTPLRRPLLRATVSFSSSHSSIVIIIRGAARKSMMEAEGEGGGQAEVRKSREVGPRAAVLLGVALR